MKFRTLQEVNARRREIDERLREIEAAANSRALTEAEEKEERELQREYAACTREYSLMRDMLTSQQQKPMTLRERANAAMREAIRDRKVREISLSVLTEGDTNNLVTAGAVDKRVEDLLPVLEHGLIWDAVGLRVMTGVKGDVVWPYATTAVECEMVGEAESLTDKDIDFAKKTATQHRMGITIKITNEALDEATFDLLGFVNTQCGLAVKRALNKRTFSPVDWAGLAGPYKNSVPASTTDATWANVLNLRAQVAAKGLDMSSFAYVCDSMTAAMLMATPKANGQGGFIMEDGKIGGSPVYVTEDVNAKTDGTLDTTKHYLLGGCWAYLAANQHGEVRFTIDPISLAPTNETRVTLNTRFSLTDLTTTSGCWGIVNLAAGDGALHVEVDNVVKTKEQS